MTLLDPAENFTTISGYNCPIKSQQENVTLSLFIRERADAVDFKTQTKIKIYSFNFKEPSF